MTLLIALALFAVFSANVMLGSAGVGVFLSDVQEMLVLLAAAVAFVAAILAKESAARRNGGNGTAQKEDRP